MELKVINTQGQDAGSVVVNEAIFAREYNEVLIHQVIKAFIIVLKRILPKRLIVKCIVRLWRLSYHNWCVMTSL
jgi:hypothetical protein